MAQSYALHSQFDYSGLKLAQQELFASHNCFDSSQAPATPPHLDTYSRNPIMTQAMLQQQFKHGSHMQEQSWSFQQQPLREYKALAAQMATPPSNDSSMSAAWVTPAFENTIPWNMMSTNPMMLPVEDAQYSSNADLVYGQLSAHTMAGEEGRGYTEALYLAPRTGGALQGLSGLGSEPDMSVSCSPGSYFSEPKETEPLSPGSMPKNAVQGFDWNVYSTPCPSMRRSSPQSVPSAYSITSAPTSTGVFSGENSSPVQAKGKNCGVPSPDDTQYNGSGYVYSHNVTASVSSRYPSEYSAQQPGYSRSMQPAQYPRSYPNRSPVASNANQNRLIAYRAHRPTETQAIVATQGNNQTTNQHSRATDAEEQKKMNDRILIQGKKEGLTYKEIRKRLVGEKPAESTLRGRYRSLTKERKDRVRKPVWSAVDIRLLNESVRQEFDRIARLYADPKTLTRDQKLAKVQWKKVADYIDEEGGSYHFGNSTCKRKWLEINVRS